MLWIRIAAILGFLFVAIGAFGAHGLKQRLEETGYKAQFETGVLYHGLHVMALLAVGLLLCRGGDPGFALRVLAPLGFVAGIVIFSGSLYALGVSGSKIWGMVTPFGGLAFLVGWVALAVGAAERAGG